MAQQGSGGIDSFLTSNFLSNFKYNNNTAEQQQYEQTPHNVGNAIFLTGSSSTSSHNNNNTIREWFSSKQNSFSSSNFFQQQQHQQSNNSLHFNPLVTTSLPISRSLSDNSLPKYQFYQSSTTTTNNNNNNSLIEASPKKKRKRCDEEFEDEEYAGFSSSSELSSSMGEIDLMREAMILPTNVDMMEENGMMITTNNNHNNGEDSSSMFFPQSMFGNSMMQFSSQHQSHNAFPLFESEEDMITSASPTAPVKKNRMSPQSHLIEFIRDNIMQYLLFHLKLDMRQTITSETSSAVTTLQLDDVKMSDSTTTDGEYSVGGVEQDVDITIPVGLLLDYIVQQAQRLYFNMYEYIRELASSPIKYQCKSVENQKEIELSLACNEFEKMVIEQVHFLLSQIELMRYNNQTSSSSSNQTTATTQIIPMLKKYDKILPKNFHTLRLVSSTSDDSIGSNADSFTLEGIVDESFLFKSTSPYIQRSSFAHNFDDMKTNSSLNDISSLLNTKFKLSY